MLFIHLLVIFHIAFKSFLLFKWCVQLLGKNVGNLIVCVCGGGGGEGGSCVKIDQITKSLDIKRLLSMYDYPVLDILVWQIIVNSNLVNDWLNGVLRHFQQYFSHIMATAHIIHVFPGFYQY